MPSSVRLRLWAPLTLGATPDAAAHEKRVNASVSMSKVAYARLQHRAEARGLTCRLLRPRRSRPTLIGRNRSNRRRLPRDRIGRPAERWLLHCAALIFIQRRIELAISRVSGQSLATNMTLETAAIILGLDEDEVLELADELGISGQPTVEDVAAMAELLDEDSDSGQDE